MGERGESKIDDGDGEISRGAAWSNHGGEGEKGEKGNGMSERDGPSERDDATVVCFFYLSLLIFLMTWIWPNFLLIKSCQHEGCRVVLPPMVVYLSLLYQ
jgi:hypothetical protein